MAFQRTHRPSLRSGRSRRSLGSPLNAYPLGATRYRQLVAGLLIVLGFFVPASSSGSSSPRIQFLGAENFPNNVGCRGYPIGTSEDQTVFAWAFRFFLVTKIDGRVERLDLEETIESPRAGARRNGDRIRQRFFSERVTALLDLTLKKECLEEDGCKTGTEYEGDLTLQVRATGQQKTIRVEVYCGC